MQRSQIRFVRTALPLLAAGATLIGCNSNLEEENALLLRENTELRGEVRQLETALTSAEKGRTTAEAAGARERAEAERLRAQLAARPTTTASATPSIPGATTSMRGSDLVVTVAGDVLFDSGSVTLRNEAKRTLDRVAEVVVSRYAGKTVRVEGYTDTDPIKKSSWKTNERLSGERAMAVESYLISRGVPKGRIYFAGFGADKPKGSKKESRRVEIVILDT